MQTTWKKEYETGFKEIDQQHHNIIKTIQKLENNIFSQKDEDSVNDIIMDLKIYTISHLEYEERLFKKYKYTDEYLKDHVNKHNDFRKKISEFINENSSVSSELANKISSYLKEWLINHIKETDVKFVKFLEENGHL